MDHEIELIRHCSPVVFKFAMFRGTHLLGRGDPHDRGRDARLLNFEIWSYLGFPGQKPSYLATKVSFRVARELI